MYCMQILMQVGPMASRPDADKYRSAWDALKRIPQREGWMVGPTDAKPIKCQKSSALHQLPTILGAHSFSLNAWTLQRA